jgi:hypothetical protein
VSVVANGFVWQRITSLISDTGDTALGWLLVHFIDNRAAAILTAAAAAGRNGVGAGAWLGGVQELAGALVKLTNLCELQLKQVPAVSEGGAPAVGLNWLP